MWSVSFGGQRGFPADTRPVQEGQREGALLVDSEAGRANWRMTGGTAQGRLERGRPEGRVPAPSRGWACGGGRE